LGVFRHAHGFMTRRPLPPNCLPSSSAIAAASTFVFEFDETKAFRPSGFSSLTIYALDFAEWSEQLLDFHLRSRNTAGCQHRRFHSSSLTFSDTALPQPTTFGKGGKAIFLPRLSETHVRGFPRPPMDEHLTNIATQTPDHPSSQHSFDERLFMKIIARGIYKRFFL